jgi:predicted AAA+ superfamily ATPase
LDEIQFVNGFEDVVNGLMHRSNLDVYVTGSNSRFLSTDVLTEFRGRGDEVRVNPLSFSEFLSVFPKDENKAWKQYMAFGGMPGLLSKRNDEQKHAYLKNLFEEVYFKDVSERNGIRLTEELKRIVDALLSSIGSLANPARISNMLRSSGRKSITEDTVGKYLRFPEESFLFEKAERYDGRGRRHLSTPCKYYVADVGLRNARLNFRQQEPTHLVENIVYNELRSRGCSVDVGLVESRASNGGTPAYEQLEIDFVVNRSDSKQYIQVAYAMPGEEKRRQELRPLIHANDSFRKTIVTGDDMRPWRDEDGILTIGLRQFLLDEGSLDL